MQDLVLLRIAKIEGQLDRIEKMVECRITKLEGRVWALLIIMLTACVGAISALLLRLA